MKIFKRIFSAISTSSQPSPKPPSPAFTSPPPQTPAAPREASRKFSVNPDRTAPESHSHEHIDLGFAAASGNPDLVLTALDEKTNVNVAQGPSGFTPLLHAVAGTDSSERQKIVEMLHAAGADLEQKDTEKGLTPLHYTALRNKPLIMEALLKCGANVHATEANGATALHGAVFHGNLEVCRLLLKAGANPMLPDKHGYTPVFLAERGGHAEILALLRKALPENSSTTQKEEKVDDSYLREVEARNRTSLKPEELARAVLTQQDSEPGSRNAPSPAPRAEDVGPAPASTEPTGKDVFSAIKQGSVDRVEEMLRKTPHLVHATQPSGHGLLHAAALHGRPEVVPMLKRAGVPLNQKDSLPGSGETALHMAVRNNQMRVVEALLAAGADVNARNGNLWTALHDAANDGNLPMIEILLKFHADINAKEMTGSTPTDVAGLNDKPHAARYLRDHGGKFKFWKY